MGSNLTQIQSPKQGPEILASLLQSNHEDQRGEHVSPRYKLQMKDKWELLAYNYLSYRFSHAYKNCLVVTSDM